MSEPRKPAPGSNSWAQSSEQGRMGQTGPTEPKQPGRPTNRFKYEDPMPTSHVLPKSGGLTGLREDSASIPPGEVFDAEILLKNQPPSLTYAVSDDGSEVMLVCSVANNNQAKPLRSAPPAKTNIPPPFFPPRSIPPLMRPHRILETNWPTPTLSPTTLTSSPLTEDIPAYEMTPHHQGIVTADGFLTPCKDGAYAYIHKVDVVNQDDSQRVASHAGIIETVETPETSNALAYPSHLEGTLARLEGRQGNSNTLQPQPSVGSMRSESNYGDDWEQGNSNTLQPQPSLGSMRSESNHGGIWENHPHVGRSLPPFTSGSPHSSPNPETVSHDFRAGHNRPSSQFPSVSFDNPWMPSSTKSSYTSSNMPSAMNTPQSTVIHGRTNPVPPPPDSYPGFQRSVQIPAGMEQMERNLHHHLDQCFGSLIRLVTDKSDKIVDQMMKHLENFEDKTDKALKGLKGEIRELKKEASLRHQEIKNIAKATDSEIKAIAKATDSIREQVNRVEVAVKEMSLKMDALKRNVEESDKEREMIVRQPDESIRRRTESANAALAHNEQRTRRPTHSPNGLGQGRQTSRGRQRTTNDAAGSGARRHVGNSTRRVHFAPVGQMRGEAPDLSQHPAYRRGQGQSTEYRQDGSRVATVFQANQSPLFQTPSQHDDWYHQAYGQ